MANYRHVLGNPFLSLGDARYRLYWVCMCLSSLALWMHNTAQPWLAYSATDSPMLLGIVSAVQFMPTFLFAPFAGVLIDRFSKRMLILATQAGFLIVSGLMALLLSRGAVGYGTILLMAAATGMINMINLPLRQAWISSLVDHRLLLNAVALYSAAFNLARIVGPAAAGVLMDSAGLMWCYAVNLLLFSAALLGLVFVRTSESEVRKNARVTEIWADLKTGFGYVARRRSIWSILLMLAVTGIFSINYSVLLPVISVEIMGAGERGYSRLMSLVGVGTFAGAFAVALRSGKTQQRFFLHVCPLLLGAVWLAVGFCKGPAVYAALAASGFFYVSYSSTANVGLQMRCDPEYVGRVVSFYTLVLTGTSPLGNLYAGTLSDFFGVRVGAVSCGVAALLCCVLVTLAAGRRGGNGQDNE